MTDHEDSVASGPATRAMIDRLHYLVCSVLLLALDQPRPSAAIVDIARAFLKDNHVEIQPGETTKGSLDRLFASMPTFTDTKEH